MQIDHMKNPLGIIKTFAIPYESGGEMYIRSKYVRLNDKPTLVNSITINEKHTLHLEGRVIAHVEDGFDDATWFTGELLYANHEGKHRSRVGGSGLDEFRRGAPTIMEVKLELRKWCKSMRLKIATETDITNGVSYNVPRKTVRYYDTISA